MILNPAMLDDNLRHKFLIGSIVPRPIAWVSSMSTAGVLNLAPFSFFTIAASHLNIKELPEFVINLTNEDTVIPMNLSATDLPRNVSEFEWAKVTAAPSETIRVPRVAEAPISFECKLQRIVTISDAPGGGSVVFGEVQMIHIRDDLYQENGRISLELLKPIARLAGSSYARVTDTFNLDRVPPPPTK